MTEKHKLEESFYQRKQVTKIARELLGKTLHSRSGGKLTSGIIVETEAYSHTEMGCHAYQNKKTKRNEVMFQAGGVSYVYLCYGIHHLFNVVTGDEGMGDAVLIRALEPLEGIDIMMERMKVTTASRITSGPGKLTKALGISKMFNGKPLEGNEVWLEQSDLRITPGKIKASARIGIDYAGDDALLPWRFTLIGNPWVSKP